MASVWFSRSILTFSFASTAWCSPSLQRRPGHQPTRELVHDHDAAVLDHVVDVEPEERVCAQGLVDVVEKRHVGGVVEPARLQPVLEHLFGLGHAGLGQRDRLVLLVDEEVAGLLEFVPIFGLDVPLGDGAGGQLRDDAIDFVVEIGRLLGRS